MSVKSSIKLILPNYIYQLYRNSFIITLKQGGFYGKFDKWEEASLKSAGYLKKNILEKVIKSCLEAKELPDKFERDGVIIESKNFSYETLSYLIKYGMSEGFLSIIDFGGSLGSTYFQFKKLFPLYNPLSWAIVEQAHYVSAGNQLLKNNELQFYDSLESILFNKKNNLVLFSATLQYIYDPFKIIQTFLRSDIKYWIIDRLPVHFGKNDIITIQYVPETIYKANYPARIFSYHKFISYLESYFNIIHEFNSIDGQSTLNMKPVLFKGFILEKK